MILEHSFEGNLDYEEMVGFQNHPWLLNLKLNEGIFSSVINFSLDKSDILFHCQRNLDLEKKEKKKYVI